MTRNIQPANPKHEVVVTTVQKLTDYHAAKTVQKQLYYPHLGNATITAVYNAAGIFQSKTYIIERDINTKQVTEEILSGRRFKFRHCETFDFTHRQMYMGKHQLYDRYELKVGLTSKTHHLVHRISDEQKCFQLPDITKTEYAHYLDGFSDDPSEEARLASEYKWKLGCDSTGQSKTSHPSCSYANQIGIRCPKCHQAPCVWHLGLEKIFRKDESTPLHGSRLSRQIRRYKMLRAAGKHLVRLQKRGSDIPMSAWDCMFAGIHERLGL